MRQALPAEQKHQVEEVWRTARRRKPWIDEAAFDILVRHDVETYLLVLALRRKETDSSYGYRTWWLTQDGVPFRIRERLERETGIDVGVGAAMRPDFFVNYLSLRPRPPDESRQIDELLPLSLELAATGAVPAQLRREAEGVLDSMEGQPLYVQRRRLRELVNRLREEGVEDEPEAAEEIEEP